MAQNIKFIGHPVRMVLVIGTVIAVLWLIAVPEQNPFRAAIFGFIYGSILSVFAIGLVHCGSWWAVRWYWFLTFIPLASGGGLSVALWFATQSEVPGAVMKWVPLVCDAVLVVLALWFFIGMILAGFGWTACARKDGAFQDQKPEA